MARAVLLLVVGLLLLPTVASANRMPFPPRVVLHVDTPCPGFEESGSCSDMNTDAVFLEPGATRFERLHELGHQFDRQLLTGTDRAWFVARLGFGPDEPWNAAVYDAVSPGFTEPAERFADAYAHCAQGTRPSSEIGYGYLPGSRTRRHRVCLYIKTVGLLRPLMPAS